MEKTIALDHKQLLVLAFVIGGLIVGRLALDRPAAQPMVISWEAARPTIIAQTQALPQAVVTAGEKVSPPALAAPLPLLPPVISLQVPPAYPAEAFRQGIEGTVIVAAYVTGAGRPARVELQNSSGQELLDQVALLAVAEWEFLPATQGGAGRSSYLDIPVTFKII